MRAIGKGAGLRLFRDPYGEMYFSSERTNWQRKIVDPSWFPQLRGKDAEGTALLMHCRLINDGVPESIVEEFIGLAGFDVTAL